jgi:hypothetical protein
MRGKIGAEPICEKRKGKSVSVVGSAHYHMVVVFERSGLMSVICPPHGFWREVGSQCGWVCFGATLRRLPCE